MEIAAAFVADEEPLEVVQSGEGALDDPAVASEAGAVSGVAACDHRLDAARANEPTVFVVVVASVCEHALGTSTRPAGAASDRHRVEQRDQLGDVVAVAAGDREGERNPGRVDEEMLLRAGAASVDRARARFGAPFFACTWLESMIARDHSISSAARSRSSRSLCSRSQTPARCHSSSRRQHVTPEPKPSSGGRCCQAIPVCSTNKIPCNASRSSSRLRPGYRKRRSLFGKSGSNNSHNSSETIHGATAIGTPSSLTTDADGVRRRRTGPFISEMTSNPRRSERPRRTP
jgi:hypothetical protein